MKSFTFYETLDDYLGWARTRAELFGWEVQQHNWTLAEKVRKVDSKLLYIFPFLSRIVDRSHIIEGFIHAIQQEEMRAEEIPSDIEDDTSDAGRSRQEESVADIEPPSESQEPEMTIPDSQPTEPSVVEASIPDIPVVVPPASNLPTVSSPIQFNFSDVHPSAPKRKPRGPRKVQDASVSPAAAPSLAPKKRGRPRKIPLASPPEATPVSATPPPSVAPAPVAEPALNLTAPIALTQSIYALRRVANAIGIKHAFLLTKKELIHALSLFNQGELPTHLKNSPK